MPQKFNNLIIGNSLAKKAKRIKDKNIRNLFATEVTEATEGFAFKNQNEKANACGICFDAAGLNSFPFSASISLCSR